MFILTSLDRYNQTKVLVAWEELPERADIELLLSDLSTKYDAAVFKIYEEINGIEFTFESKVDEFHVLGDSEDEDEYEEQIRLGIE